MVRYRLYVISGYLSVIIGLLCAASVYNAGFLFYGMALSFFGFVFALLNILLNAKYDYEGDKYPKGFWGLFFCSFPIVFFFVMYKLGR